MTPGRALSLALLLAPLIALTALVWAEGRRLQQGARPMADRIPLDDLTSDQLDALYDERDQHAVTIARVRHLAERWRHTGDRKHGPLRELLNTLNPTT